MTKTAATTDEFSRWAAERASVAIADAEARCALYGGEAARLAANRLRSAREAAAEITKPARRFVAGEVAVRAHGFAAAAVAVVGNHRTAEISASHARVDASRGGPSIFTEDNAMEILRYARDNGTSRSAAEAAAAAEAAEREAQDEWLRSHSGPGTEA